MGGKFNTIVIIIILIVVIITVPTVFGDLFASCGNALKGLTDGIKGMGL